MFAAFLLPTILARRHVSALAKPAQERLVRKKPEPLGNRTDRVVAVMQTLAGHRQPHPVENFAITSAEFLQLAMQTARASAELHRDRFLGGNSFDDHRAQQVPQFIGPRRRTTMRPEKRSLGQGGGRKGNTGG